jgi:hypothetical protein
MCTGSFDLEVGREASDIIMYKQFAHLAGLHIPAGGRKVEYVRDMFPQLLCLTSHRLWPFTLHARHVTGYQPGMQKATHGKAVWRYIPDRNLQ